MSRALLRNTAWGVLGEFVTRGGKIAQVVLMARVLGAEDLGRFNYGLALAGLFSVLFDFGVATIAVRELARSPGGSALRLYGRVKLLGAAVGMLLMGVVALSTTMPLADRYLAFGLGLYLALNDLSTYAVVAYRARGQFWRETTLRTGLAVLQLLATIVALFLTHQVEWVVVALVAAAACGFVPLAIEWVKQPPIDKGDGGWPGLAKAVRECAPVAGTVLVGAVYMNLDVVVLAHNASMDEVGWYSVAVKTIFGLLIMPLHYLQLATLPVFAAELGSTSASVTGERWLQGFALSTTAGALLCLSTAAVATELLTVTFGEEFAAGGPVLVLFVLVGFLFYLYTPLTQWLLLLGKQRWTLCIQAVAMAVNVALVLACVPRWGVWGAVVAAGVTHATIAVGHFLVVWHVGGFSRREPAWWSLFRVTAGLTLAVATLHLGVAWPFSSRVAGGTLFVVCAHREIRALAWHIRAVSRSRQGMAAAQHLR